MIFLTGGAGFIGSNLLAALSDRGSDVAIADYMGQDDKWRNVAKHAVAAFVDVDRTLDWLDARAPLIESVVHLGAISSTTERDVDKIVALNIRYTLSLWDWCTNNDKPFIYASSAATYGDGSQGFDDDGETAALARLRPLNPYAWSKHVVDRRIALLQAVNAPTPPQWVGLKFFNVFGPNEYHKGDMRSIACKVFEAMAENRTVSLFRSARPDYADGEQCRDFVYVKDCVDVLLWLLATPSVSGLFNVGTGKARSFLDLASAVFQAVGRQPDIDFVDMPKDLAGRYQYFTEAAMTRLVAAGYTAPMTSLEDAVEDYVTSYLSQQDPYR
jgi:ADP-L-glycero-D-manno-heptose 6-epimerase